MWKKNRQSIFSGDDSRNIQIGGDLNVFHTDLPKELIDQKIEEKVEILRQSRSFREFDRVNAALVLGRRLVDRDLSCGTDAVRCRALAWCARILLHTDELDPAEEFLTLARSFGTCPEVDTVDACVLYQRGDKRAALKTLAGLDSPLSKSTALMIVGHHEGAGEAVRWLENTGITAADLDPDGRRFCVMMQLELEHWDTAKDILRDISANDTKEAPILHHMFAITQLLTAVPVEFRATVFKQLPFELAEFPLSSDEAGIIARRAAQQHFVASAAAASELNLPSTATMADAYALWLELRDPDRPDKGRQRLQARLRDTKSALGLVPLALQFGIDLDLAAVEQEIGRQTAFNGGMTQDAALARCALAFTRKSPEDVARYIEQHHDALAEYLDVKALRSLQLDMWSRAGSPERATACLELLLQDGLSKAEEDRLRGIISEAEGADPVKVRKEHYDRSKSLTDLLVLVAELEAKHAWEDLCQYGAILFDQTRSVRDAERLVIALSNMNRTERTVEFLQAHSNLLSQSDLLQMSYAQALYHEGALLDSRHELAKLSHSTANPHYRSLHVHLCIAIGDWNSLSEFVANELAQRVDRSADDLMRAAQLALQIGSPQARELVFAAVAKGGDDPGVLATAYFLASSAGWENEAQVGEWFIKATELSGDQGPLKKISLKDILDQKPGWDHLESEMSRLLSRGEIPLFSAAQSLRKSLIDLMLFPALANPAEKDPRRRGAIPTYSGKREPMRVDPGTTAGMEATALLTLGLLGLLKEALDAFKTVWVPHSTLTWLFDEKQKTTFHQPSRIRDARHIRDLLATSVLEQFVPSTIANSDLSAQVGDELAALIAEAEQDRDGDNIQRLVVHPGPVHRASSLMDEEADLTAHAEVMSSCLPIVEKLRKTGQITAQEEQKARAYLQLHENPWPSQPEVMDGAVLYLAELAVTYLLHVGMLGKLRAGGLRAIASSRAISEADAFIAYGRISEKIEEKIERIRSAVSAGIESGKIKLGRRRTVDESEQGSTFGHPTLKVIALADECDVILSDDRFLNQHFSVYEREPVVRVATSLDLLDTLLAAGAISDDMRLEHRTFLRRAGYFFVPVSEEELSRYLGATSVENNKVIETAELKAIRESILRVRMSDWLRLPEEGPWLQMTLNAFNRVLKSLWKDGADVSVATARSNWIVDQIDVRGWAHLFEPENGDNIVKVGRVEHIGMLLTPPSDTTREVREAYWHWAEGRILVPIKEQFPDLYSQFVEWQKADLSEIAEMDLTETETT